MKLLSEDELSTLSRQDRYDYYDKIRQYKWSIKTREEKKQSIFSGYHFLINKRGIEGITLEEEIKFSLENKPTEKSNYVTPLVKQYHLRLQNEKFTFFWETSSPFSQWHKSIFKAATCLITGLEANNIKKSEILRNEFPSDLQEYSSTEQFMMYHKAIIFLDIDSAKKIMSTNNVRKIKEFGRRVSDFNEEIWKYYRSKIVFEGNKAKFEQNQILKEELLKTKGTTLVEASPNDKIWGIGVTSDSIKAKSRNTWEGLNLLGEILTTVRVELSGTY
jgi:ribA/ribD-fused uncharacterized protein